MTVLPEGVCWDPDADALEENPDWQRLDMAPYRLATGFTITRGRSSETDKTVTGTASLTFRDTDGILDPTNTTGPFYGKLDPMKQVALSVLNPVSEAWWTLFRGFVAGRDHQLDMFTDTRGYDQVTWSLVDAFDLLANVILTHGVHGDPPPLSTFPNIYYKGGSAASTVGSGFPGLLGSFVHVDQRIVQLLDDAGWPGTGANSSALRSIFSGNVSVQGVVYSRKDSLLSAMFDAADAEFPGIANIYVSKDGVVTFHGRFARFFPDNPGYGINHWYVGSGTAAALDPDIIPLSGPLRFYRSKDDILNDCYALPAGVDETDGGVVHYSDAVSQGKYGYRSENFDGLLTFAGHNDDWTPTTAVEECNKFADYYVGNYADPHTRVGTLRFVGRDPGSLNATALWDFITRVDISDVITLFTTHPGGGGFQEDFYVEQLRYSVEPGNTQHVNLVLEVEVSPASFFGFNPFGDNDNQFS